jgi:hypothetical protein
MQGYVRVSPAGANLPLMANISRKAQAQIAKASGEKKDDSHEKHEAARKDR